MELGVAIPRDLLFMPYTGEMKENKSGHRKILLRVTVRIILTIGKKARVGYYSVMLDDSDVLVELTATERVGYHRYTFPKEPGGKQLMIDLKTGMEMSGHWKVLSNRPMNTR